MFCNGTFVPVTKSFYLITGQSFGTFLYSVPRPGGQDHVPHPSGRWEDFWKHVWARAEAQHHLAVLLRPGAACAFSPSGPRQALPAHHAAHGHRWTDWCVSDRNVWLLNYTYWKDKKSCFQITSTFSSDIILIWRIDFCILCKQVCLFEGVSWLYRGFNLVLCSKSGPDCLWVSGVSCQQPSQQSRAGEGPSGQELSPSNIPVLCVPLARHTTWNPHHRYSRAVISSRPPMISFFANPKQSVFMCGTDWVFSGFRTYSVVVYHWAEAYVQQAQEVWWLTRRADTALWLAPRLTRSASCCFSHGFVPAATLIYQHHRAQRTQRSITF